MTIEELIVDGKKHLHTMQVKILIANIMGYDTLELLNHLDEIVTEEQVSLFRKQIEAVKNNIPLQYIVGNVNFYGYTFKVNPNVLIPRFETEELIENTIKYIKSKFSKTELKVIDLGCGSGVIGITLKKKIPNLDVTCLDISEKALEITKENAEALKTDVVITKGDMLENVTDKYDIIISNPPYIKTNEEIEEIVMNNEPHLALYAGVDGLYYYDQILKKAKMNLHDDFLIAFEIGHTQREDITNLAHRYLENIVVECKKDLSGRDRMIFIYPNNRI